MNTPKRLIGIESKLKLTVNSQPFVEQWGDDYQSIMRHSLNQLQLGVKEKDNGKSSCPATYKQLSLFDNYL